jgi:glutathione S-transferase
MDQDRPPPAVLYHIAAAPDWAQAQRDGEYRMSTRGRTLAAEGFIHASTASQVIPVANAYYRDEPADLLLLVLDPARIGAEIRWEQAPGSADPFPHIYGPLPVDAVRQAIPLERDESGQFRFPT